MREILFRGKSLRSNEWVYGDLLQNSDGEHKSIVTFNNGYNVFDELLADNNTIGQYTGIKDKNGTNIFEGDILYTKHGAKIEGKGYYETYHEVVFKNGAFGVIGKTAGEFLSFDYLPIDNEVVCGNIYENEELLK